MVGEGHRASQVFDNIRALFGKTDKGHEPINMNEITLGVLTHSRWRVERSQYYDSHRADVRTAACHGPSGSIAGGPS